MLLSQKRRELVRLEDATGKRADVRVSDAIAIDRLDYYAYDERGADIEITKLPNLPMPRLDDLEKLSAAAPAPQVKAEEAERGGRRRRRTPGPAEASHMVMTGAFDDVLAEESGGIEEGELVAASSREDDESVEGEQGRRRRRRRRRGRRGRGGDAGGADQHAGRIERSPGLASHDSGSDATDRSPAGAEPDEPRAAMRVHEIAKDLGISSRDVIERCQSEEGMDVKNHFSRIAGELVNTVYGWFASVGRSQRRLPNVPPIAEASVRPEHDPLPEPSMEPDDADGPPELTTTGEQMGDGERRGKRRSRRRRRRGRGGQGRDEAGTRMSWSGAPVSDDGLPVESHERDSDSPSEGADEASSEDAMSASQASRRDGGGTSSQAGDPAKGADDAESSGRSRRRRGRRGRGGRGGKGGGRDGAAQPQPQARSPRGDHASPPPMTAPPASAAAPGASGAAASTKPRRTLYRNRSRVSKAARDAAAKLAKP